MRRMFYVMLVALTVAAMLGAGCNTVRGAGKDIQRGGERLQRVGR